MAAMKRRTGRSSNTYFHTAAQPDDDRKKSRSHLCMPGIHKTGARSIRKTACQRLASAATTLFSIIPSLASERSLRGGGVKAAGAARLPYCNLLIAVRWVRTVAVAGVRDAIASERQDACADQIRAGIGRQTLAEMEALHLIDPVP